MSRHEARVSRLEREGRDADTIYLVRYGDKPDALRVMRSGEILTLAEAKRRLAGEKAVVFTVVYGEAAPPALAGWLQA